jgi:hypothetical protein
MELHTPMVERRANSDILPIPQNGDSVAVFQQKLSALADAVSRGQSIAVVTNFAVSKTQERDCTEKAVADMSPQELEAWNYYAKGKYPLPKIDWDINRGTMPTSTKPLRVAHRRAEALNRLYNTDNADPTHSVWFTENELPHLPLVKAMARVIGAERDLLGGQSSLNATQLADLQSINEILSMSAQILAESGRNSVSARIATAQRVLAGRRHELREMLGRDTRKGKEAPA